MTKGKHKIDYIFLILLSLLVGIGLIMLWSASTVESQQNHHNTSYYFIHQLLYGVGIGLLGMYVCSRINYHTWKKLVPLALLISFIALVLVEIPGIGFGANGATRWIHIGPLFFQPSEPVKLAIIMYLASWVTERGNKNDFVHFTLPPILLVLIFGGLIIMQPDMGTFISICLTAGIILFVGGMNLKHFAGLIGAGIVFLLLMIKLEPYRMQRITAFLDRSADPLVTGYQINQALIAIGSGGWFGYGYGHSRQKYSYLPEAINDSIFAIMAEELGFIRILGILIIFILFLFKGLSIAKNAPDNFGKMLAIGIVGMIGSAAIVNIGAITGLLPLTGIPLPFFSYGSSAMIVTLSASGILYNISKQS